MLTFGLAPVYVRAGELPPQLADDSKLLRIEKVDSVPPDSQEAYQREREALKALAEERERRHKAELLALEAQMQAKLEGLTRANEGLTQYLDRANLFSATTKGKQEAEA